MIQNTREFLRQGAHSRTVFVPDTFRYLTQAIHRPLARCPSAGQIRAPRTALLESIGVDGCRPKLSLCLDLSFVRRSNPKRTKHARVNNNAGPSFLFPRDRTELYICRPSQSDRSSSRRTADKTNAFRSGALRESIKKAQTICNEIKISQKCRGIALLRSQVRPEKAAKFDSPLPVTVDYQI